MANKAGENSLDLVKLLLAVRHRIIYIIIAAVVFGAAAFGYTKLMMSPVYEAKSTIIISTRQDKSDNVTVDQINSASMMANTYMQIVKSETVLNSVIRDLKLNMTTSQLSSLISYNMPDESMVLTISVKNGNVNTAKRILSKIISTTSGVLKDKNMVGSFEQLDPVNSTGQPVSPNAKKNAMMAALLAAVIYIAIIVAVQVLDNTYGSEDELKDDLGYSVLGVIPSLDSIKGSEKKGGRR